jgi:methyltransferase
MAAILAVVFVPMLIEAHRAGRNEWSQRSSGGFEPPGDVYQVMQVAYPLAFLAMIGEGAARGVAATPMLAAGAVIFAVAKALKWWAILTLGRAWTFRVIVVPGARRIRSGPYRYVNHPNYVAVVGELVGVALMAGARVTGPLATVAFALLILKRIAVENRAIQANLVP